MSPPCPLTNKMIENEIVEFTDGEKAKLLDRGVVITIEEFKECDIGNNVVIRIKTENEVVPDPPKPIVKKAPKQKIDYPPFNTSYEKPSYSLSIEKYELSTEVPIADIPKEDITAFPLSVEGVIAGIAMVMAVAQQAKQKKNEAESKKCCADSKVKFSEYDSKISQLDKKIDDKTKEESKAIHAEMYEQYKELKDMRDDAQEVKDVLSKLIKNLSDKDA